MTSLLERLTGVAFLAPAWLLLAFVVPLALWVRRRSAAQAVPFAPATLLRDPSALPATWRTRSVGLPALLQTLALLLVAVALARPVQRDPLPAETAGIDLLLCVDVSSSMRAEDLDARRSRLDVAKDAGVRFVEGRPHDRIGLVSFARFPDVRCPPTLDHAALREALRDLAPVPSDAPEDATGIGTAVARCAQILRSGRAGSKVVVLLTDGEENVATARAPAEIAPVHAAQLARELGVRVYTIAAGDDASDGRPPVDTRAVRELSERTGGRFFAARDARTVGEVYAAIDALERTAHVEPRFRVEERFAPFLAAALVLLAASVVLRTTALDVLP